MLLDGEFIFEFINMQKIANQENMFSNGDEKCDNCECFE